MSLQTRFERATPWIERAMQSRRALIAATLALVVIPVALIEYVVPALGRAANHLFPASLERWVGGEVDSYIRTQTRPSKLEESKRLEIQTAFDRLKRAAGLPDVTLVFRSGAVNAFAGGGRVVVMDELVKAMRSTDHVSGVLAHELGHLKHAHSTQSIFSATALFSVLIPFLSGDHATGKIATALGHLLVESRYSREREVEADRFAYALLESVGERPAALGRALALLSHASHSKHRGSGYTLSHPPTPERISAAHHADWELSKRQGKPVPPAPTVICTGPACR